MKRNVIVALLVSSMYTYSQEGLTPVSFEKVTLQDEFWSNRMKIQKQVLVPVAFERTQEAVNDLRLTGEYLKNGQGTLPTSSRFNTSDLYKVIEGAAYLLKMERDPALEKQIDEIAEIIAGAQEPDGYLYPAHSTGSSQDAEHWGGSGMGDKPYSWVVHSHELYNVGHLYEAAVAYYQATGKRNLLEIALKSAQHVNQVFFEGDPGYHGGQPINQAPGHQEIELALVKLYRVTGDPLYLEMAKKFIDIRGITYIPDGEGTMSPEYAQQHAPVRCQHEAVGHAVRAVYLYSAMSDVGTLTGDPTLSPALNRIWHNIVDTRMHITGGLGAIHGIEGFGPPYELPNKEAYNETCAAVGNVFFNHRMFLLEKDGKYMDVAEVALLNNVLAGVNLEGNKFFYVNPLASAGMVDRSHWFGTACCPTNLARLIPQLSGMMYAHTENEIYFGFYAGSEVEIPLTSGHVKLVQSTAYPFEEKIRVTVTPSGKEQSFSLKMRIPTWTGSQFVPGALYSYTDKQPVNWELYVNGEKVSHPVMEKGFVCMDRKWNAGDQVELRLPMPVRYNKAIEAVQADRGKIAVTSGPLVYCAEGIDNEGDVNRYVLTASTHPEVSTIREGVLQGISSIRNIPARYMDSKGAFSSVSLTLVPYYAWNNRGVSTMNIWFYENETIAKEETEVLPVLLKDIQASYVSNRENVWNIMNGKFPVSSSDTEMERWTSGARGKEQQIEFIFDKPTDVKSFSVYWYDDNERTLLPENGIWNTKIHRVTGRSSLYIVLIPTAS
ncbi:MAG: glycoside hydrolase family 127 protein [Tannerellaceae bacterium]|nr:glycoside hydrolase family 127 protein [Tannerellaceae bacterium]